MWRVLSVLIVVAAGCGEEEGLAGPDPSPEAVERAAIVGSELYRTCGDPVCSGWTNKGLPRCRGRAEGDVCGPQHVGRQCDPHDACNATLICATEDPIDPDVGCPISRRAAKKDIAYVDTTKRAALADELLKVKLATYRYNEEPATQGTHLGFIIEDVLPSPAVAANGQRVDLYAYTSMAVAALQVQQEQIEALTREVAELRASAQAR